MPTSTLLHQLHSDLWEWDMPEHRALGLHFGRRMTIVRLPAGDLWVHSPIAPTDEVVATLARLGPVGHLVGPNRVHDCYLAAAQAVWPAALLHGAPGLARSNRRLRIDETLGNVPFPALAPHFDQHLLRGQPHVNEVVCLHRASRTLIIADLLFNFGPERDLLTRLFMRHINQAYGRPVPSRLFKSLIKDRAAFRASLDQIIAWDFDRIIVGHGALIETNGKSVLREAFAFL